MQNTMITNITTTTTITINPAGQARKKIRRTPMNRIAKILPFAAVAILAWCPQRARGQAPAAQQPPPMPMQEMEEMHHHHGDIPLVTPQVPRMGRSQENPQGTLISLEDLEKMAFEKKP